MIFFPLPPLPVSSPSVSTSYLWHFLLFLSSNHLKTKTQMYRMKILHQNTLTILQFIFETRRALSMATCLNVRPPEWFFSTDRAAGDIILDRFELRCSLGSWHFSTVSLHKEVDTKHCESFNKAAVRWETFSRWLQRENIYSRALFAPSVTIYCNL